MHRIELDADCSLIHWRSWLDHESANALFECLKTELEWEQRSVWLFGKWVPQPRLIAWYGDLSYRYSGLTLSARPEPSCAKGWLARVSTEANRALDLEAEAAIGFNHVLLNHYRDGKDSMGWHSDAEAELGSDPPVASLSLGAPRDFLLKPRKDPKAPSICVELGPGDLLLMAGATQHRYVHAVPKRAARSGERISLTFRRLLRDAAH
jgi:alkylated DNA repair dioxygenase AlkB